MKELQKYNDELESEWNKLYCLLQNKNREEELKKKASVITLLSLIEERLSDLNKTRKELAQQLNEIERITSATQLSENEILTQKLSSVLALLDDVNEL